MTLPYEYIGPTYVPPFIGHLKWLPEEIRGEFAKHYRGFMAHGLDSQDAANKAWGIIKPLLIKESTK